MKKNIPSKLGALFLCILANFNLADAQTTCVRTGTIGGAPLASNENFIFDIRDNTAAQLLGPLTYTGGLLYYGGLRVTRAGPDGILGSADDTNENVTFAAPGFIFVKVIDSHRVVLTDSHIKILNSGADAIFGTADDTLTTLANTIPASYSLHVSHDNVFSFAETWTSTNHIFSYCDTTLSSGAGSCTPGNVTQATAIPAVPWASPVLPIGFRVGPYIGMLFNEWYALGCVTCLPIYYRTLASLLGLPFFELIGPTNFSFGDSFLTVDSKAGYAGILYKQVGTSVEFLVSPLTSITSFVSTMQFSPAIEELYGIPQFDDTSLTSVAPVRLFNSQTHVFRVSPSPGSPTVDIPVVPDHFSGGNQKILVSRTGSGDLFIAFNAFVGSNTWELASYRCF